MIEHRLHKLANGLRIVMVPMQDATSVSVSILVGVGSRYETFERNGGLAHFLEHLVFKGTPKRPDPKIISEEIDSVGGYNNAYTDYDHTCFFVKLPGNHAEQALELMCDMIRNSLLDPEEVDREREVVIEEMNVYRDNPARYIGDMIPSLLWPDDNLGHAIIGSEQVIAEVPRDEIMAYKERHYQPNNLVVAVAGAFDADEIVRQADLLLGDLPRTAVPRLRPARGAIAERRTAMLAKETNQAHLLFGARGYAHGTKEDDATRLLCNLLGRGASSRLFVNVRERKGLAYDIYADTQSFIDTGVFEVYAGVNIEKAPEAIGAVLEELRRVRRANVTLSELAKAKSQAKGGLLMAFEDNANIAQSFGSQLILYDRVMPLDERLAKLDEITVADIRCVAEEILAPEKIRLAIIAPEPQPLAEEFEALISKEK